MAKARPSRYGRWRTIPQQAGRVLPDIFGNRLRRYRQPALFKRLSVQALRAF